MSRLRHLIGQHPVEEHAVGDRAAQAAQPGSHGGHDDARLGREALAEFDDGAADDVDLRAEPAGPYPDPEPRGVEPETVDLRRDPARLVPVDGKDSHAELDPRCRLGEVRQRLQAGRARLVVRPQRVVAELLAARGQLPGDPGFQACGDPETAHGRPTMPRPASASGRCSG